MEEEPAPAEEPAEEEGSALDDLFDFGSILTQPGGFDSLALRRWTDNTGSYQVDARMLSVSGTHVKLMKATGRTTTVPLSRLSSADLEFVNLQASAQKAEAISRTAQR